jgi:tRNA threonylcarbamoyladenosine biosynthesis protein TsaE
MKFITSSANETQKTAQKIAKKFLNNKYKQAFVVALFGELGSGKTTFTQGFAKAVGIKSRIISPTFIIMRRHKNFYHFDAYRLKKEKDILALGWKEIISNPENIVLIEWAEKIKKALPKNCVKINFKHIKDNKREIIVS